MPKLEANAYVTVQLYANNKTETLTQEATIKDVARDVRDLELKR